MEQLRWLWTMCFVTSGLLTVQSLQLHELLSEEPFNPSEQRTFFLPIEITNRVFNSQLLSSTSDEYKIMYKEVVDLLDIIYECSNDSVCPTESFYGGVTAMTFSSGSVIANSTVVFNTLAINPSVVHILLVENADNRPQTLQLNLDFTTIDKIIEKIPETITSTTPETTTTPTVTATTITTTTPETTTTPTTTATTITTTTPETTTTPTTTATTITTTTPETTTTPTVTETTITTTTPETTTTPTTTATTITTTTPETTTTPTTTATTITTTTPETTTTPTQTTTPMTTTTTTAATTALMSTTIIVQDPTTSSSSDTNVSADDTTLFSTTITHHGTHHTSYTGDEEQNSTQDPVVENSSTENPHGKWTDSQGVSEGKPSDPQPSGGGSSSSGSSSSSSSSSSDGSRDWVPGWGIALLVLASAILLLLIIIFIMMIIQCCKKTESIKMDTAEDLYYTEKKQLPQEPLPVYSPQTPMAQKPGSTPFIIEDTPKKNKSGFYAVNP